MNRLLLTLLLAAGLAACASQQRIGPPAPVVGSATGPATEPTRPAAPPPPDDAVEVYPYRPPSSAPDEGSGAVLPGGAFPRDGGLISERATTGSPGSLPAGNAGVPAPKAPPTAAAPAEQTVALIPPAPAVPSLPPAASALVKRADQQQQSGDHVGAAATLERALGIAPQDPYIWNRLARVRVEQGLYAQAGNLAKRSNALAGDRASLKQDNWRIIGAARRSAGDAAGAQEAERKARGG